MSNLEGLAQAWAGRGWVVLLAMTVATLGVALLRRPCRLWFGAAQAYQLWLLPPLAIVAAQVPHGAGGASSLPPVVLRVTGMAQVPPVPDGSAAGGGWMVGALALWALGVAGVASFSWIAQRRFRGHLAGAALMPQPSLCWPVWRSLRPDVGPATVGAWRPCIVVPADFDTRYDEAERALILAHEACHAQRGDGRRMLCAQVFVALFWFHPLAWWAVRAFRHDQELACDAVVLHNQIAQRRTYARAMLKTQAATCALPVGCCWSPHHPVTERIAMLNRSQPGFLRRHAGAAFIGLLAVGLASVAYAANQLPAGRAAVGETSGRYTLRLALGIGGQPARLRATACLRPGQYYETYQGGIDPLPPWHARFTVVPAQQGLLEVRAELSGGSLDHAVYPKIRTHPGQQATIEVGRIDHDGAGQAVADHTLKADLTPSIGC